MESADIRDRLGAWRALICHCFTPKIVFRSAIIVLASVLGMGLVLIVVDGTSRAPLPQSRPVIDGLAATFGTSLAEVRSKFPNSPPLVPNRDGWILRQFKRDPIVAFMTVEKEGVALAFDADQRVVGIYLQEPFSGSFRGIRLDSPRSVVERELGAPHKTYKSFPGIFRSQAFLVDDYVIVIRFRGRFVDWIGFHLSLPRLD